MNLEPRKGNSFLKHTHTCGTGQHPCPPWGNSQQVVLSGHDAFPSGHLTLNALLFREATDNFANHGIEVTPCEQVPVCVSHVYPVGQQCTWSWQQTACETK